MPRLTAALLTNPNYGLNKSMKNRRLPQDVEKLKNKPIRKLALKNMVTQRGSKENDVVCIQEMMVLFGCLEVNDFNQSLCAKETEAMQACYGTHLKRKAIRDQAGYKEPIPGATKFTKDQLNVLLSRYPQKIDQK
ncbi:coiled-coil-helix-coiled-coil-helix domain-containing protein 1-like protein [Leptotrombidium deliense]|uniref:Coiled-coil-helix-coiled-coil-helix domain-containing protein 1-like protein n=1 Tax=Leptotrombidium deliense TaxID=299467 RepID=A0A443SNB8_9ACAR|nr:coiled-coil-helix-coiled-coil-helix domain-containing protein 1-like protein [Leptotrombidium deliense]